ncbi:MAG: malonic semialdehyde reductase [Bauldia sp.]
MNQVLRHNEFDAGLAPAHRLDDQALDQLFREARSQNGFLPVPVADHLLEEAVELAKLGPTAANNNPFRVLFVKSAEGKEQLKAVLSPGNVEKTMAAPVTAIVAYDAAFHQFMPRLFPHMDLRPYYEGNPEVAQQDAFRNGTLQAAYFILALRSVGLDAGPVGGFDAAKADEVFFAGTSWKSNFLVNIGYGDATKLFPRLPRLNYEEIAKAA